MGSHPHPEKLILNFFSKRVPAPLQGFLKPGNIVVVTEAVRDEGISHYYLAPETKIEASPRLRDRLVSSLEIIYSWSEDGHEEEILH